MNVKIVTKDCNLFFGEIKNVQSSESPSEFLRNHLHCQFIFFSLTKTFTSQFVNEDAFKNEKPSDLLSSYLLHFNFSSLFSVFVSAPNKADT